MITGSCLCKSVTYKLHRSPSNCSYCYCSVCRKISGGAMATYGALLRSNFEWTSGKAFLKTYQQNESSNRVFCSNCGSCVLSYHDLAPDYYYVSLGCLDLHDDIKIEYQQFTASKAAWVKLDPLIQQYEEYPNWIYEKYSAKK